MPNQPTFTTPSAAIAFISDCIRQDDPVRLYAAFIQPPGDFWKERLFVSLCQINDTNTLQNIFLEDGQITSFPEKETRLHLGGHDPRTHYLHIDLVKNTEGWGLESILMCR